jgi:4-diphosphocytidyl-2-C-methyl-D-erythritol kinase
MISLKAPAKINLSFEVIGKRDDGFHEVRTVLQAIDLADVVEIEEADEIRLTVEPVGAVPVEGNLVLRAAVALREATGVAGGAAIMLRKRIPVAAGLGADVPFFLRGGTAIGSGRGDAQELLPMPVERFAVVVTPRDLPADEAKTSRLYGLLKPQHFSDGSSTGAVVFRITKGQPVGNAMRNTFAAVASVAHASYEMTCTIFGTTEAGTTMLAGAGPSLFALVEDEVVGERIRGSMELAGYEAHLVGLLRPWPGNGLEAD